MRASTRSLAAFKAPLRDDWDRVAPAWQEWWPLFEQGAQPLTDRLLELAGVGEGQRVLDIATGIGEPAGSAARLTGSTGQVVAIDRSPRMLAIARDRAKQVGLPNITFRELDAGNLDFPDNSFDACLCRWGLMYMDHLVGILDRVRRQLVPEGYLAAAVWAASPKVPFMSLPVAVIARTLRLPPQPGDASFNLANRHALADVFGQAGFIKVQSETVTLTMPFADAATYTRYLQAVSPALIAMLAPLPPDQQDLIWKAVGEAARQRYAGADGRLLIPGEAICMAGQKP